ncbi:metallophosphoesterase family protein [Roseibium sp.]|uniref:metallophosphoesterase family protein n=1 Tax=Roseibium sp. TaxID=1936156 RepID=UPI003D14CB85
MSQVRTLRAISDLHLASAANREALAELPSFGDDWLIVAGDIGERLDHVRLAFETLTGKFARVFWVPGNHDLWSLPDNRETPALSGEDRYRALVACAREFGVLTPEDPFQTWESRTGPHVIAPLFLLYDYSFRPDHVGREEVVGWAREQGAVCADEYFLSPAPYESREHWCEARLEETEARLAALPEGTRTVLVNHYPLRRDLIHIPRAPRFTPWCGTRRTEDWHLRFNASVVVSGHLHTRRTDWRDGARFEEVSLGYPRQWDQQKGMAFYLRSILSG